VLKDGISVTNRSTSVSPPSFSSVKSSINFVSGKVFVFLPSLVICYSYPSSVCWLSHLRESPCSHKKTDLLWSATLFTVTS
jgi:hypothetical protein